jgi:hypothetical protein
MTFYIEIYRNVTGANPTAPRTTFARAAVFAEFRPRDARAIDYCNFVDRCPNEPPGRLSGTREAHSLAAPPRGFFLTLEDEETSK